MNAPPSKSMMVRAVAMAIMAEKEFIIENPSYCDDALAALDIAEKLGCEVCKGDKVTIRPGKRPVSSVLNCKESALCMRMFSAITDIPIKGEGSLLKRVLYIPEVDKNGSEIVVDGSHTSQFITGLLIALPFYPKESFLRVKNVVSKPYIALTLSMLQMAGIVIEHDDTLGWFRIPGRQRYTSNICRIEGDWSGAAFMLVAAVISGKGRVSGLSCSSEQGDKVILEVMRKVGAEVFVEEDCIEVKGGSLQAFEFDATDYPDLLPPFVALACYCKGKSSIKGIGRLKNKESDRVEVLLSEFSKIGAKVSVCGDIFYVEGTTLYPNNVSAHNDHRIAMACAVAGVPKENIKGAEAVSKSFPTFFEDLYE